MIPKEYRDDVEENEYQYYLWGDKSKGIITNKRNPLEMSLSDIVGEYIDGTIIVTYIYDKVGSEETGEITPPNTGVSTTNSSLLILSLLVVNALGASVVLRKNN